MSTADIYNHLKIDDQVSTGGQPTAEQLQAAAAEGFVTVLNLATDNPRYSLKDEAGLVRALGLTYIHIPVDWDHPQAEDFAAFERAMQTRPAGRLLLHCAANFRATAFYGLYAQKHLGWSLEQAEALRAQIWQAGEYPAWERLIAEIRAQFGAGQ